MERILYAVELVSIGYRLVMQYGYFYGIALTLLPFAAHILLMGVATFCWLTTLAILKVNSWMENEEPYRKIKKRRKNKYKKLNKFK